MENHFNNNLLLIKTELREDILITFPDVGKRGLKLIEHDKLTTLIKNFIFNISGIEVKFFSPSISTMNQNNDTFNLTLTIFENETMDFFRNTDLVKLKNIKDREKKLDKIFSYGELL
jgi:hypothetical protein